MATAAGIETVVCDGTLADGLTRAAAGESLGTVFAARDARAPSFKLWLRYAKPSRGTVRIDDGAARVLREQGSSLLPVGIVAWRATSRRGMRSRLWWMDPWLEGDRELLGW